MGFNNEKLSQYVKQNTGGANEDVDAAAGGANEDVDAAANGGIPGADAVNDAAQAVDNAATEATEDVATAAADGAAALTVADAGDATASDVDLAATPAVTNPATAAAKAAERAALRQAKLNNRRLIALQKGDPEKERVLASTQTATLIDYVEWVGDVDFDTLPLREADALVLCVVVYFDLSAAFVGGRNRIKLSECLPLIDDGSIKLMITGGDMGNTDIFRAAAASVRFGELEISEYEDKLIEEPPIQFAAMCFSYLDRFSFAAFRGTDSSLAGWEENFMISFTRTTAQTLASEYAARLVTAGRTWYIGGHSKGGNLALTAACMLTDEQLGAVERVYMLDGPGFCPDVYDETLISRVDPKTTRVIPEFDVIGKLFEPRITDTRIVKSYRKGIEQHSLASWLVNHGELAQTETNAPGSRWINDLMDEWIAGLPLEERAVFVGELFDALEEAGIKDFQMLEPEYFGNLIVSLRGKSTTTKKVMGSLPQKLLLDDAEKLPFSQKVAAFFKDRTFLASLAAALLLVAAGLIAIFASQKIMELVTIALLGALAAVQAFLTVRRLIRAKGKLEGHRERIIITIVLFALIPVVLIKENATFIFGSLLFGALFLVIAYISGERAGTRTHIFMKVFNIVECVAAALLGLAFLMVPSFVVHPLAIGMGIALLVDAAVRIGFLIWERHAARAAGGA